MAWSYRTCAVTARATRACGYSPALGGDVQAGRTFLLKDLRGLADIAAARPPRARLPPALHEYLGNSYERLKTGRAVAHTPGDDQPVPDWMKDLAREMDGDVGDIFDQMDQITARNQETRRLQAQLQAQDLIELGPEQAAALAAAISERARQAAMIVDIPAEHRARILDMARGGAPMRDLMAALGLSKTTIWRSLYRLRVEGAVELRGKGRATRWHATGGAG